MDEDLYHQRTLSETAFSPLKDDGELRSRSWHGQFRELTRKCIVHNLSRRRRRGSPLLSLDVSARDIAVIHVRVLTK